MTAKAFLVVAALVLVALPARPDESERFGELALYRGTPHPSQVVLFVSGGGGWNQGVVDMARALASLDALVVGIDIRTYLAALRKSDDLIALIGPEPRITFEFPYTDWLGTTPKGDSQPVEPEVEKLRGKKLLCVYGADETDSICPRLPAGLARLDEHPGGHHMGGDSQAIADRILAEARR